MQFLIEIADSAVEYKVLRVAGFDNLVIRIYTTLLRSKPHCYFVYPPLARNHQIQLLP